MMCLLNNESVFACMFSIICRVDAAKFTATLPALLGSHKQTRYNGSAGWRFRGFVWPNA